MTQYNLVKFRNKLYREFEKERIVAETLNRRGSVRNEDLVQYTRASTLAAAYATIINTLDECKE